MDFEVSSHMVIPLANMTDMMAYSKYLFSKMFLSMGKRQENMKPLFSILAVPNVPRDLERLFDKSVYPDFLDFLNHVAPARTDAISRS